MSDEPVVGERPETVYFWEGPPTLELTRRRVTLPSGMTFTSHTLITQNGRPGVVIVAGDMSHVLLVRQSRPTPTGMAEMLELPRGFGEVNSTGEGHVRETVGVHPNDRPASLDSACADAERELLEETGYRALSSQIIGSYITDSALLPGKIVVVAAEVKRAQTPDDRDGEVNDVLWVRRDALREMIRDGLLADAHTLSALSLLAAH